MKLKLLLTLILFCCSLISLNSCDEVTAPPSDEAVQLRTASSIYSQIDTIHLVLSNTRPDTIWWDACSRTIDLELQIRTDTGWVNYFGSPWDCLVFTGYLQPSQKRLDHIIPFIPFKQGIYRVRFIYSLSRPGRPDYDNPDTVITIFSNLITIYGLQFRALNVENDEGLTVESMIDNPLREAVWIFPCVERNVILEVSTSGNWNVVQSNDIVSCEGESMIPAGKRIRKVFAFAHSVPPGVYRIGVKWNTPWYEPSYVYSTQFKILFNWVQP